MDRVHSFFVTVGENASSLYTENYCKMNVISDTGIEVFYKNVLRGQILIMFFSIRK